MAFTIGTNVSDGIDITSAKKAVEDYLKMDNLTSKDSSGNVTEEAETVNNYVTAKKSTLDTYGIRQEIITQNTHEDAKVTALRKLNDNCIAKEEIEVECIGDTMYKVGHGVHVILPFLPKYSNCNMYIKEVSNEWKDNGIFISTLTLTPSRVMDEQEWEDLDQDSNNSTSSSNTAKKIIALLTQQIGKPYVYGATGTDSFDCSGLTYYCYNQFSDELIDGKPLGRTTYEQVKQGTKVDANDTKSWNAGDLVFPNDGHVVVYLGDNKVIHAPQTGDVIKISDLYWLNYSSTYAVRRVIPEDTASESSSSGYGGIPDDYASHLTYVESNCSTFISNMKKYGFKDSIVSISKSKNVDPYITASIIAIESEGNPACGSTYYGLMQVAGGSSDAKTNIGQGLDVYNNKKMVVGQQIHVLLSAYNSGEGTVKSASASSSINLSNCSVKQLGDALYDYVKSHYSNWDADEKKYYSSKVLKAYSILKGKNALN